MLSCSSFFFNGTATTEIYTLSLHDALPIYLEVKPLMTLTTVLYLSCALISGHLAMMLMELTVVDRKSGSAGMPRPISYAVFCLKKKKRRIHEEDAGRLLHLLSQSGSRDDLD